MGGYVLRRLWQTIPVLFGVSLLAFAIMHVVPGDPVRLIAGPDAPESVVEPIRVELGLDRPLHEQYWSWVAPCAAIGAALRSRAPVADEILARFPATLGLFRHTLPNSVSPLLVFLSMQVVTRSWLPRSSRSRAWGFSRPRTCRWFRGSRSSGP